MRWDVDEAPGPELGHPEPTSEPVFPPRVLMRGRSSSLLAWSFRYRCQRCDLNVGPGISRPLVKLSFSTEGVTTLLTSSQVCFVVKNAFLD